MICGPDEGGGMRFVMRSRSGPAGGQSEFGNKVGESNMMAAEHELLVSANDSLILGHTMTELLVVFVDDSTA